MEILFTTLVGSKLYGLNNEFSDTDIKGFGIPELRYIIGMDEQEQIDSKNGLEGREKIESTIFGLKKYLKLAASGNPTILEIAFAYRVKDAIITETSRGQIINQFVRKNLITKDIYPAYRGYFQQQLKKLMREGDRQGKRQNLIDQYGYDTKFAMHAYRLGCQAVEMLTDPDNFSPAMSGFKREYAMSIREGMISYEMLIDRLKRLDDEIQEAYTISKLPEESDFEKVKTFYLDIMDFYIGKTYYG